MQHEISGRWRRVLDVSHCNSHPELDVPIQYGLVPCRPYSAREAVATLLLKGIHVQHRGQLPQRGYHGQSVAERVAVGLLHNAQVWHFECHWVELGIVALRVEDDIIPMDTAADDRPGVRDD